MLQPSDFSGLERNILRSCHLDEWHASAWFPRPYRDSLNLIDEPTDEEVLDTLLSLIRRSFIQVGRISDDGRFLPELSPSDDVLADMMNNRDTDFHISTKEEVYQIVKNAY
jgi:hypothetical protein